MRLMDEYLGRRQAIIGQRTQVEERYDHEVINWLKKGLKIKRAIEKANQKYPEEALKVNQTNVDDVVGHYEYLMQHLEIMQKISAKQDQE